MLKLYNTLTRKKEVFKPLKNKDVHVFVCGPTTYDYSHIGHAKTYTQFDVIVKYLRWLGHNVFYLQNITNIEDKIIQRAKEKDKEPLALANEYEEIYHRDMQSLGIGSVNKYARATDYIKAIESQVQRLISKKIAYKISDGYYFDLTKFPDYGKLAKRKSQDAEDAVSRIDDNPEKRNKGDFCLWKFSKPDEPSWKSELGAGRPGWHIEDTAITEKEFGPQYDIHGGAVDLIFPHHEAEIAQMESISGKKPMVKYWLHSAFLNINKRKMSKSLKNFVTIRDALERYDGKIIRYFFASQHYRTPISFSYDILEQSKNTLQGLNNFIHTLQHSRQKDNPDLLKKTEERFIEAMNDDFNTPQAFAAIFDFMHQVNKEQCGGKKSYELMLELDQIFNVLTSEQFSIPAAVKKLAEKRETARKRKEWKEADSLRENIEKQGFIVEDLPAGYRLKPKAL